MVKLNEIQHTATFAWSNDSIPVLATGTSAGVIDDDFSSSSTLSFHSLYKREPLLSVDADAKFHDLDWSQNKTLIAGALDNGSIQFWNTEKLASDNTVTSVATGSKHTGAIKSIQFNPIQHNVLASGGANSEIYIWDTAKLTNLAPFAPGTAMTPMDTVTSVSWNKSVSHIFAAAGSAGYTSIWDLKSKKEVLHLTYTSQSGSRATLSTVAWHPSQSTKLITASESDGVPLILTWDLRNSNAPEQILEGHKKGVLSLDWNARDPTLLLSCGKDNTTILWNPISGEKLAQYPTTANWAFKTRFAPRAPDVFATSSFDKKVVIQTLQDTSPPVNSRIHSTTDNDFWSQISTTETQQPEYFVKQAPNWFGRHSSVAFGFGGKIVTVSQTGEKTSEVKVNKAPLPGSATNDKLTNALNSGDFKPIIETRLGESFDGINKADWELLDSLDSTTDVFEKFVALNLSDDDEPPVTKETEKTGEDFFTDLNQHPIYSPTGEFKLSKENKGLTEALLSKNLNKAVDISLNEDKLIEALIIALNGPQELKDKVTNFYFNKFGDKDSCARLLYSVSSNNVSDLVENGDVANWREIGTAIKTYAASTEVSKAQFATLGDRILAADPVKNRQDSVAAYINASALDKVAEIWNSELKTLEEKILETKKTSVYDAHFASLSEFVEKFSAYRSKLNLDAPISEKSSILSTILEYINIISTNGQFELASRFLSLLPSDVPAVKLEQERIAKATGVKKTQAATTATSTRKTASNRYGSMAAPSAPGFSGIPPAQPIQTQIPKPVSNNPYLPNAGVAPSVPVATPSYGYQPVTQSPYAQKAPLYGQPTSAAPTNPYMPASAAQTPAAAPVAVPPPPKARKNETDGWNDLPSTFHQQPARRSTPAAVGSPSANGSSASPSQKPALSRTASYASAPQMPPPPRSVSRTRKTPTLPEAKPAPQPTNRYAPASPQPNIPALNGLPGVGNGFAAPPPPNGATPSAPPKNPYAPAPGSTPAVSTSNNAYAPPQMAAPPVSNPYGVPPPSQTPVSAPPVNNPYAPTQAPQAPSPSPYAPQQNYGAPAQPPAFSAPPVASAPPRGPAAPPKGPAAPPKGPASTPSAAPTSAQQPAKEKYPAGDRSHIPSDQVGIYEGLNSVYVNSKSGIPEQYTKQFLDAGKRLDILYDHLNNQELSAGSIDLLGQISAALQGKDFGNAMNLHLQLMTSHSDETGHWALGVKKLIQFAEAALSS